MCTVSLIAARLPHRRDTLDLYSRAGFRQSYEVTADGRAFLFVSLRRTATTGTPQVVWVDHWFADLATRGAP